MSKELLCESKLQSQNMLDSASSLSFQNQDSYTPFLEHPLAEKSSLEKSIEILQESALQFQNSSSQSIDRLETQLSQLVNIYKNEKTLSYQPLTNPNISSSINLIHDSCCFENQDSYTHYRAFT